MSQPWKNELEIRKRTELSQLALAKYENIHAGERCVIIGNGPSLNQMDLSFLKNEITFGLNRIYLGFERWNFSPSYYVAVNPFVIEQSAKEIQKIACPKFLSAKAIPYLSSLDEKTMFLESIPEWFFSRDPRKGICEGFTVTYVAMQLAYFMGFSEVFLIGVDHSFVSQGGPNELVTSTGKDPNHFDPNYFGKGVRWQLPDLRNSEIAYRFAKDAFEASGRSIKDATAGGKLEVYPKVNYRDIFMESAASGAPSSAGKPKYLPAGVDRISEQQDYLVSAIVSTYNDARFMRGRLQNLVDQTLYKKGALEIVVIDSNSPDREREIVSEFMSGHTAITYLRTSERETVYAAWNRGIRSSKGKYVINANVDDRFSIDGIEKLAEKLNSNLDVQAAYGDWLVTNTENDTFNSSNPKSLFEYPDYYPPLFLYFQITSHAALIRKRVFDQIGYFDERFKVFGDRELMLRFAIHGLKASHIPEVVGLYLENGNSLERSEKAAPEEFESLRDRYFWPDTLSRLFGYSNIPDAKSLAQLYATAGAYGKDFYTWRGNPVSDLNFAARLFQQALDFDPANVIALNNLGVLACLAGQGQFGEKLFREAQGSCTPNQRKAVRANASAIRTGAASSDKFEWLQPEGIETQFLTEKPQPKNGKQASSPRTNGKPARQMPASAPGDFPLVSVIVPTYNRRKSLARTVESIANQTHPNLEIIVVNDGGEDIASSLERFKDKCSLRTISNIRNRGAGAARNTGLRLATGKYVAFLDDDDVYRPNHIEKLVSELEKEDQLVAAYSDALQVEQRESRKKSKVVSEQVVYSLDFSPAELFVRNYIPILCLMARREALPKAGFFDETMPALEDWEWLIRLSQVGPFLHIPEVTAEYVVRLDGKSRNMLTRGQIQGLYQGIYRKLAAGTTAEVRSAQRKFYALTVGRDLEKDLPELFDQNPTGSDKTGQFLQFLLDSDDIEKALQEHESELDGELLALVNANVDGARRDGDEELAAGLEDLAAYIQQAVDSHVAVNAN